jgi:hypothetical protein
VNAIRMRRTRAPTAAEKAKAAQCAACNAAEQMCNGPNLSEFARLGPRQQLPTHGHN